MNCCGESGVNRKLKDSGNEESDRGMPLNLVSWVILCLGKAHKLICKKKTTNILLESKSSKERVRWGGPETFHLPVTLQAPGSPVWVQGPWSCVILCCSIGCELFLGGEQGAEAEVE